MIYNRFLSFQPSNLTIKLKRAWRLVRKFLSFSLADDVLSPKQSLCISIEKGGMSIVSGTRFFSKYRINGYNKYSFSETKYPRPADVASAAILSINDSKSQKAEIVLCIPREWTIFQTADLPIAVRENLSDVISYELDRLTPLNPENAYYDYLITSEHKERLMISLTVANADFTNKYLHALKDNGIDVNVLTSETSAVNALLSLLKKRADFIFLAAGDDSYEGLASVSGTAISRFSGIIAKPDNESMENAVAAEIGKAMKALRSKRKGIQFIASFEDISHLHLEQKFSVPIRVFRNTDLKINFPNQSGTIPYAAVGGVMESLSVKAKGANLLSRGRHKKDKTPLLLSSVLFILLMLSGVAHLIMPLQADQKKLYEIERRIAGMKEEVNKVEVLIKERELLDEEISTVNDFKNDTPMTLAILKELTIILPKSSWLTRMRITDRNVDIEGYSSSSPADMLAKLEASEYLQKAEFASPTVKDMRMNADRFIFKMEIEKTEE